MGVYECFWVSLKFVLPEMVTSPLNFMLKNMLIKIQPKRTKIPNMSVSGRYWAFLGRVALFLAQNCYIANLLLDYAHSLKISARADQNSQSGLFERFRVVLGGVDIFRPEICYITNVLFNYEHSVKISAQADQNSQTGLFERFRVVLGRFWVGLRPFLGPQLLHRQCTF